VVKLIQEVVVLNRAGMHARVCSLLYSTLKSFTSEVILFKGGQSADCRRVIEVLSLGAAQGSLLRLEVEGEDAQETMNAVLTLFESRFFEEDESTALESERVASGSCSKDAEVVLK